MKDNAMLDFYKSQSQLTPETAYPLWCAWCQEHDEPPGSLPEFMGRLRRTHEAMLRMRGSRLGHGAGVHVGGHP